MLLLGIDLGTTKVASVLIDTDRGEVVNVASQDHHATMDSRSSWEHIQDPDTILAAAQALLTAAQKAAGRQPIAGLVVTGQMHGILYLDASGVARSPLYTWLDARGAQPHSLGSSFAEALSRKSGHHLASGYGLVTHYYNSENRLVPADAHSLCTLLDYVTMRFCATQRPLTDETTAASIGLFDLSTHRFDAPALERVGMRRIELPSIAAAGERIGTAEGSIPVFAPVADNQASFIGSVADPLEALLVNLGTGGQVSRFSRSLDPLDGSIERRPFPGGGFLEVGAALCSGKAYEQLRGLFADVVECFGGDPALVDYERMNRLAGLRSASQRPPLLVDTRFAGTRTDAAVTGSITGVSLDNLTASGLVDGFLGGIADELFGFYETMLRSGGGSAVSGSPTALPGSLVGSGNALRRNHALREAVQRRFGKPISIPVLEEEAALGAALCAGVALGIYPDYQSAGALIRYEDRSGEEPGSTTRG